VSEPVAVTSGAKAVEPSPPVSEPPSVTADPVDESPSTVASPPADVPPPVSDAAVATEPDARVEAPPPAEPTAAVAEPPPAEEPAEPSPPVADAPPVAAEPAAREPVGDGLAALLAAWPDVVTRLSADPPTKPLILACRPVAVDGAIVTLGFPEEQSFLKDAIERRRAKIEAGIAESLGHEVTVRCVVANIEVAPPPDPQSEGALVMAEAGRIFADVRVDVGEVD
jgi:hypothetical protein